MYFSCHFHFKTNNILCLQRLHIRLNIKSKPDVQFNSIIAVSPYLAISDKSTTLLMKLTLNLTTFTFDNSGLARRLSQYYKVLSMKRSVSQRCGKHAFFRTFLSTFDRNIVRSDQNLSFLMISSYL